MKVNPNYETINIKSQQSDPHSILHYYVKMIEVRKQFDTLVYGNYQLLETADNLVAIVVRVKMKHFM